jgi:hypothetical protein
VAKCAKQPDFSYLQAKSGDHFPTFSTYRLCQVPLVPSRWEIWVIARANRSTGSMSRSHRMCLTSISLLSCHVRSTNSSQGFSSARGHVKKICYWKILGWYWKFDRDYPVYFFWPLSVETFVWLICPTTHARLPNFAKKNNLCNMLSVTHYTYYQFVVLVRGRHVLLFSISLLTHPNLPVLYLSLFRNLDSLLNVLEWTLTIGFFSPVLS